MKAFLRPHGHIESASPSSTPLCFNQSKTIETLPYAPGTPSSPHATVYAEIPATFTIPLLSVQVKGPAD